MPLPAYITAPVTAMPSDIVARQIDNLGVGIEISRTGNTIAICGLETGDTENQNCLVTRSINLLVNHADAMRLVLDAVVYPVQANIIDFYLKAGFQIHSSPVDEDDEGAHTLLRRMPRQ